MTTDYGIYCQTCQSAFIADIQPLRYAKALLHNTHRLAAIDILVQQISNHAQDSCFDVILIDFCRRTNVQDYVEWLRSHSSGCNLVICDEYGGLYDANGNELGEVDPEYIYNLKAVQQ